MLKPSIDLPTATSTLPPSVIDTLSSIVPPESEVSSEVLNAQYLQANPNNASAVLGAARSAHVLDAARDEVEATVFGTLNEGVSLDIKVREHA